MKNIKSIIVGFAAVVGLIGVSQAVLSANASAQLFDSATRQACQGTQLNTTTGECNTAAAGSGLTRIIRAVINILSVIIGVVAVIMIIVNGFKLIMSGGDSNAISGAKKGIIYALIGLAVVALAQFIVWVVLNATNNAVNPPPPKP